MRAHGIFNLAARGALKRRQFDAGLSDLSEKKAGHCPAFSWDHRKLRLGCAQAEDLPVLHAAPVPLDFVGRVAKLQQVFDVVGRLAAPHAVAEHDGGLCIGEVKQTFAFRNIEDILHDFGDLDWGRAFGRIQLGPRYVNRAGDGALADPVGGTGIDHDD